MDKQVQLFDKAVEAIVDRKIHKQKYTKICPYTSSKQYTRVELDEAFWPYLADAVPTKECLTNDKLIYRFFRSPSCGIFVVFATTRFLKTDGLSFGQWKDMPSSAGHTECVMAERIDKRCKHFIITGIPLRICAQCSMPLMPKHSFKCARCRDAGVHVRYCGEACQQKHWVDHKSMCDQIRQSKLPV